VRTQVNKQKEYAMFAKLSSLSAFLVSLSLLSICLGQVDIAREHSSLERIKPEVLANAIEQIQWKHAQDQAFMKSLEMEMQQIDGQQVQNQQTLENIQHELPPQIRFATDEVQANLTGRCLEELLSIELELATTIELHNRTQRESTARNGRRMERELESLQLKSKLLSSQRDNLAAQIEKINALIQKKILPSHSDEVTKAQNEKLQVEASMSDLQLQMVDLKERLAEPAGAEVADMRIKIESMKARKAAVEKFLAELSGERPQKFKRHKKDLLRAQEFLERKKDLFQAKIHEVQIRYVESESFLSLLKERLKQNEKPADQVKPADQEADKKGDKKADNEKQ